MTNFPNKIRPNYSREVALNKAKLNVSKDTINKMVRIIEMAKELRSSYSVNSDSKNAIFSH